jgi:two-component system LytT family response regulator
MSLTCYVVDDELYAAEMIAALITRTPGLELVGLDTEDELALKKLLDKEIVADIVFLDIELNKINGLDFALKVKHLTHVVLVTGEEKYAIAAFEHGITDYLLKPVLYKRFLKSIERVKQELERKATAKVQEESLIHIRSERQILFFKPEEIVYIESASNYLKFHLTDKRVQSTYKSLSVLSEDLQHTSLMRIHRSFMVNLNKVVSLNGNMINMGGGITIQLGASYRDAFLKRLNVKPG